MDKIFREHVDGLPQKLEYLMNAPRAKVCNLPLDIAGPGIYLFSEQGKPLYVGRANNVRGRLQSHCRPSGKHNSATFAFRLAAIATGREKASYKPKGSRADLQEDPIFAAEFAKAKERVRNMDVQFVAEKNPVAQALLEIYVAVTLCTPHNDFNNH